MIEVKLDDRIIKVQPDLTLDKFMKILRISLHKML